MSSKNKRTITRRRVLQAGTGAVVAAGISAEGAVAVEPKRLGVYERLGLKKVINAIGTVTFLGGSVMPPEVVEAWVEASKNFVNVFELQDKVGAEIAKILGVEAAMVSTGAAGSLLLGTAAVITRGEKKHIAKLPDTTGMKNEVILQKTHHSCYDQQLTDVGVKLIDVETADDVAKAVNDRTALMFFMNIANEQGRIPRATWIELARKHKIPTLIDAAADTPPLTRMTEYLRLGFDLVAFSGGKAIRGPNDAGLLLGRKEFIEAAKFNTNPHCGTIGRMMKVSKEDMVAMLVAVERFVKLDVQEELREWERRIGVIEKAVREFPTVETERIVPAIANHMPHLIVDWNPQKLKITREQVTKELLAGDPSIQIGRVSGTGDKGILFAVHTLQEGEDRIIADRLRAILTKAMK